MIFILVAKEGSMRGRNKGLARLKIIRNLIIYNDRQDIEN